MDVRHPNQWMIIRMILWHLSCGSTTAGWWEAPGRLDIFGILEPAWAGWFACILQPSASPEWSGHLTDAGCRLPLEAPMILHTDLICIWFWIHDSYTVYILFKYYSTKHNMCIYRYRYRYTTGAIIYVDQCISKYTYIYILYTQLYS